MDADASAESVAEVVMALPERPSTVIVMAPTASEGPKPAPDTFTRVPLGPDVVPSEAVAAPAAAANESNGAVIEMMSSAVKTATVAFLNCKLLKLLIFILLIFVFSPI